MSQRPLPAASARWCAGITLPLRWLDAHLSAQRLLMLSGSLVQGARLVEAKRELSEEREKREDLSRIWRRAAVLLAAQQPAGHPKRNFLPPPLRKPPGRVLQFEWPQGKRPPLSKDTHNHIPCSAVRFCIRRKMDSELPAVPR